MPVPKRTEENKDVLDRIAVMPIAEYTFGFCYYGHNNDPFKTVTVLADSIEWAKKMAWKLNDEKVLHSMCWVKTDPNPARVALMKEVGWL